MALFLMAIGLVQVKIKREWVLVIAHHYRGKFGDHRHCGSEDIMALVLSRDHARTHDQMVI